MRVILQFEMRYARAMTFFSTNKLANDPNGIGYLVLFSLWMSSFKETSNIVLDLL